MYTMHYDELQMTYENHRTALADMRFIVSTRVYKHCHVTDNTTGKILGWWSRNG